MDDTQSHELLHQMEAADPAEAPPVADLLAETLEAALDPADGAEGDPS